MGEYACRIILPEDNMADICIDLLSGGGVEKPRH